MLDRATNMPSARRSIRFFDAVCSALHFAKRMAFIDRCGSFGAVLRLLRSAAGMTKRVEQLPLTVERLERALVLLAYFIELDGDVHLSMYEKFEAELGELKTKEAIKNRARKRLESYLNEGGGLKAIR
jgi:cell division protein FtsB